MLQILPNKLTLSQISSLYYTEDDLKVFGCFIELPCKLDRKKCSTLKKLVK